MSVGGVVPSQRGRGPFFVSVMTPPGKSRMIDNQRVLRYHESG